MYHGNLKVFRPNDLKIKDSNLCLILKGSCFRQRNATFTPPNRTTFFIVYEVDTWSLNLNPDFTLKDCLFGGPKLAKNVDPGKYVYSGYGMGLILVHLFHFQILIGAKCHYFWNWYELISEYW